MALSQTQPAGGTVILPVPGESVQPKTDLDVAVDSCCGRRRGDSVDRLSSNRREKCADLELLRLWHGRPASGDGAISSAVRIAASSQGLRQHISSDLGLRPWTLWKSRVQGNGGTGYKN